MKKTVFTITAMGILAALACCKKKDTQPGPKSRTELLTGHEWRSDYSVNAAGDTLKVTKPCQKDNTVLFGRDGSYLVKANEKCEEWDSDITGTWRFLDNESAVEIIINLPGKTQNDTASIVSLTEDELVLKNKNGKLRIIK